MSFKSNLKKCESLTAADIGNYNVPSGFGLCRSFNNNPTIDSNTKLIIVGTLTPPEGRKNGYFYSADGNGVYGLLDNYFAGKSNFLNLKNKLIASSNKAQCVEDIKNELKKFNIAFLDVIDCAIASTTSPNDNEILYFNLDFGSFKNVLETLADFNFVCTSKNAVEGLLCILKKFGIVATNTGTYPIALSYNNKKFVIDLAPQIVRGKIKYNNEPITNRRAHWMKILAKYI